MSRVKAGVLHKTCALPSCGKPFDTPDKANYREKRYCSKTCSNRATTSRRAQAIRDAKRYQPPICPCGKEVPPPPGQQYIYKEQKKYCCPEHRKLYGQKRQKDPANWVTFTCQRPACGREFTLPRSYTSVGKYCSNECSAKHNRTKQHIVVEDAMVLDSPYEALFYGLMRLWKIPCERADRGRAISVNGSGWYAPDFYLPDTNTWVEVKGFEEEDHRLRYDCWRMSGKRLAVLKRGELHALRTCLTHDGALSYLASITKS